MWELNMCYNSATVVNRVLGSTNGFNSSTTAWYWSSTEGTAFDAKIKFFETDTMGNFSKNSNIYVRAVRIHTI
jgi:hypothetical protein